MTEERCAAPETGSGFAAVKGDDWSRLGSWSAEQDPSATLAPALVKMTKKVRHALKLWPH
jgi:hypothetical protein